MDGIALHDLPLSADGVDGLADVVALVVVRRLVDHQPVLVAALQHLLRRQLLQPLVLGQRVALRRARQDSPVVHAHRRAARRGHPQYFGWVCRRKRVDASRFW